MTIIKNWLLEGLTDPKTPAASGDRFDELGVKTWAECNAKAAGASTIAAALRAAAKEAQLRILSEFRGYVADQMLSELDALVAQIEKAGPL